MKRSNFLKSAAVLSAGGLIAKGIGAIYRIPLAGLLGGYGMGLYQMAYPVFCVLLTFSSAGIPSAFSRMIARESAQGRGSADTLKTALKLFAAIGLCGAAVMAISASFLSRLQGEPGLAKCYLALAPAVFLVALIAVLRGYFQGKNDMRPTAVSEIAEQLVKAALGLYFARRFSYDPVRAVAGCLLAVTLSEAAALFYLATELRGRERKQFLRVRRTRGSDVLFSALPVMAAASLLPVSQAIDSVMLVRLLGAHSPDAVALYGLFTGGALSLIRLPAALCYGLAAASVPSVSRCFARGDEAEGRRRALYALAVTLCFSVPCAAGLFLFARPAVRILFSSLGAAEAETLVRLLRSVSVSAITLAGVDTLAACLTGMGRAGRAAFSMTIAVLVKFALQQILVPDPAISIGGAAIAANVCYLVAFFLDLFYTVKKKRVKKHDNDRGIGNVGKRADSARVGSDQVGRQGVGEKFVACLGRTERKGDRVRNARFHLRKEP